MAKEIDFRRSLQQSLVSDMVRVSEVDMGGNAPAHGTSRYRCWEAEAAAAVEGIQRSTPSCVAALERRNEPIKCQYYNVRNQRVQSCKDQRERDLTDQLDPDT